MAKQAQPIQPVEPEEVYLVSKVNRKLIIPKDKRSFPNKETLAFTFKAGIPQKVPAYAAKAYAESYPHVYSIVRDGEAEAIISKAPTVTQTAEVAAPSDFNAVVFLNNNHPLTKDKLITLGDKEVFQIAGTLELNPDPNTPKGKLIEQILTEVEVRNK
ncbi:MAG: hypothetical protein ABR980_09420 [Ignavibacteriaceae bacterium]|jgi:hypothetical protein